MLIDRIFMATCFTCLQNGLLYILLPMLGSILFGINGMWTGFALAPVLTLGVSFLFAYLKFGKNDFPYLLNDMDSEIEVMDDTLTETSSAILSGRVTDSLAAHGFTCKEANLAALFVEETGLTILEKNKGSKKPLLIELSLFYEDKSVLIVERDSGELFDLTDSNSQVKGLSSFVLSGLMEAHDEKKYLVTTGYNRNMIRFTKSQD